ncbi:hypothetical protein [Crocinitomix catalasitica]|uniref:hypothetical protein n=1 Tax=Crocinitomix catalasitica TaxID=184607 RepID=UPI0004846B1A|nr:hypothetical protein [Crocinitomix catalasitica]
MKTITLIIAASLTMLSFVGPEPTINHKSTHVEEIEMSNAINRGKKQVFKVSVQIGRKKKGCTGFGICKLQVAIDLKVVGEMIMAHPYVLVDDIVGLEFIKDEGTMSKEVVQSLNNGKFIMEEGFQTKLVINKEDSKRWNIEEGTALKMDWPKGIYKATKTEKGWLVTRP